jgi:hypothetical protein
MNDQSRPSLRKDKKRRTLHPWKICSALARMTADHLSINVNVLLLQISVSLNPKPVHAWVFNYNRLEYWSHLKKRVLLSAWAMIFKYRHLLSSAESSVCRVFFWITQVQYVLQMVNNHFKYLSILQLCSFSIRSKS